MSRDWTKLDELILYIAERCSGDPRFGKIKLNKILFYADFSAYLRHGSSITGEDYIKQPHGPVPCHVEKRLAKLSGKDLEVVERDFYGRRQHRVVAKREARLNDFSAQEIALVDQTISHLEGFSGADVSELSHQFLAWQVAQIGEVIPYQAGLAIPGAATKEKLKIANELSPRAKALRAS